MQPYPSMKKPHSIYPVDSLKQQTTSNTHTADDTISYCHNIPNTLSVSCEIHTGFAHTANTHSPAVETPFDSTRTWPCCWCTPSSASFTSLQKMFGFVPIDSLIFIPTDRNCIMDAHCWLLILSNPATCTKCTKMHPVFSLMPMVL